MKFEDQVASLPVSRRLALQVAAAGALAPLQVQAAGWYGGDKDAAKASTEAVSASAKQGVRLALLVGNRVYPSPFDLPPVHKNVRDLKAALEARGFQVTTAVDQDPGTQRNTVSAFAKTVSAAPSDASVLFYFTGHGLQVDAENLMLAAGVNPSAKEDTLNEGSVHFQRDLLKQLPSRPQGMTMLVMDACRTSLRAAFDKADGFNQVEAPLGCLIAFSTAAGKPAISPAVETQNTFYTGSLVKVLNAASDDITFSELFRLVKIDVQQTMLNHPVPAIRLVAQNPFIAENTKVKLRLSPTLSAVPAADRFESAEESTLWRQLQESTVPGDVLKLATQYTMQYPKSRLVGSAEVAREGASEADKALRRNDVRLYRSAFAQRTDNEALRDDLHKSARGDKDAAARVARWYQSGGKDVQPDANRYEGWMQYAAALGNGIACYELALYYRKQEQPLMAAQFETRARELGFTPPPSLDHNRK
ncbi:MAG: hypothetical protein RJB60_83 [Pseudomonadota bacterium]|jgi:hypothetical protein